MLVTIKVGDVEIILDEQSELHTNIKYHTDTIIAVVKAMTECVSVLLNKDDETV